MRRKNANPDQEAAKRALEAAKAINVSEDEVHHESVDAGEESVEEMNEESIADDDEEGSVEEMNEEDMRRVPTNSPFFDRDGKPVQANSERKRQLGKRPADETSDENAKKQNGMKTMEELIREESGERSQSIIESYTAANGSYPLLKKWYRKSQYAKNDDFLEKVLQRKRKRGSQKFGEEIKEDIIVMDLLASHSNHGRRIVLAHYKEEFLKAYDLHIEVYYSRQLEKESEHHEDFIKMLKKTTEHLQISSSSTKSFMRLYRDAIMSTHEWYQVNYDWLFKEMLERPIDMLDLIADLKPSGMELYGEQLFILLYTILKWQQDGLRNRCLKHLENIVAKSSKDLREDKEEAVINISYLLSIDELPELLREFKVVFVKLMKASASKSQVSETSVFSFESFLKVRATTLKPDAKTVLLLRTLAEVGLAENPSPYWASNAMAMLFESLRSNDKDYREWISDEELGPLLLEAISKGCQTLSKHPMRAPDSRSFLDLFISSFYGHPHLYTGGSALMSATLFEKLSGVDPNRKAHRQARFKDHRSLMLVKILSSSLHDVLSVPLIPLQLCPRVLVLGLNSSVRYKVLRSCMSEDSEFLTSDGRITISSLQNEFRANFVTIDTNNFKPISNYELPRRYFKEYFTDAWLKLEYARGKLCHATSVFPDFDSKIRKTTGVGFNYKFIVEPKRISQDGTEPVSLLYCQRDFSRCCTIHSLRLYSGETSNVYRKPYLSVEFRDNEWMIFNPVSKKVILRINPGKNGSQPPYTTHPLLSRLKICKYSRYSTSWEVNASDRTLRRERTTRFGRSVSPSSQDFDFIVKEKKRDEENSILSQVKVPIRRILGFSSKLVYYNEHCELYSMNSPFVFSLTYKRYKILNGDKSKTKKFVIQQKRKLYWLDIFNLKSVNKPKIGPQMAQGKSVQVVPAEMGEEITPPHFLSHYDPTDFNYSFEPRTSNLICMIKLTKWKVTTANACGHLIFTAHIDHPLLTEEGYAEQERKIAKWNWLKPDKAPVVMEEC